MVVPEEGFAPDAMDELNDAFDGSPVPVDMILTMYVIRSLDELTKCLVALSDQISANETGTSN